MITSAKNQMENTRHASHSPHKTQRTSRRVRMSGSSPLAVLALSPAQPWPLRYLADKPSPAIESLLSDLIGDGVAVSCLPCVYEPETDAFGGPEAMDAAHELFHSDSRHLLTYQPSLMHLGRRETAVLLASAMMRGSGLDWFEQGDVWAKVAALRPAANPPQPERAAELAPAMRKLMTADAHSLCRPGGPLHAHEEWVTAFERAGATLADLAARGALTRGLRAVIARNAAL